MSCMHACYTYYTNKKICNIKYIHQDNGCIIYKNAITVCVPILFYSCISLEINFSVPFSRLMLTGLQTPRFYWISGKTARVADAALKVCPLKFYELRCNFCCSTSDITQPQNSGSAIFTYVQLPTSKSMAWGVAWVQILLYGYYKNRGVYISYTFIS